MRRQRESAARMHATPPITVVDENPMDHHPGLTPLEHRRIKRIAKKMKGGKAKAKVKVEVEVKSGGDNE